MQSISVFDGVFSSENSYTNLLRNLLRSDFKFGQALLRSLLPEAYQSVAEESFQVFSQKTLRDKAGAHGRADLVIETASAFLLVEIKVDPYCQLTINQNLEPVGSNGYVRHLEAKLGSKKFLTMAFIAPHSWKQANSIRNAMETQSSQLTFRFRTWEEIASLIDNGNFSEVVCEFGKLLRRNFVTIAFSDEEREVLREAKPFFLSASRKLHELVKKSQKEVVGKLGSLGSGTFSTQWGGDTREFGYSLLDKNQEILWVGLWDQSPFALSIAVHMSWRDSVTVNDHLVTLQLNSVTHGRWRIFEITAAALTASPLESVLELVAGTALSASNSHFPN